MKNHGFVQAVNTIKFELSLTNFELWAKKEEDLFENSEEGMNAFAIQA